MRDLNIVKQDDILQFAGVSDHTVIANQSTSSDKSAVSHFRIFPDNAGSGYIGTFENGSRFGNPDIFLYFSVCLRVKTLPEFNNELFDLA